MNNTNKYQHVFSSAIECLLVLFPVGLAFYFNIFVNAHPLKFRESTHSSVICEMGPCWVFEDLITPIPIVERIKMPLRANSFLVSSRPESKASLFVTEQEYSIKLAGVAVFQFDVNFNPNSQALNESDYRFLYFKSLNPEDSYKIKFVGPVGVQFVNPPPEAPVYVANTPTPFRLAFISSERDRKNSPKYFKEWTLEIVTPDGKTTSQQISFQAEPDPRGVLHTSEITLEKLGSYRMYSSQNSTDTPVMTFNVQKFDKMGDQLKYLLENQIESVPIEVRGP